MRFFTLTNIEMPVLDSFHLALNTCFTDKEMLCVIITSEGGCIDTGFAMQKLVIAYQKAGLKTKAIINKVCGSIAVPVFMAFDVREAFSGARIFLHSAAFIFPKDQAKSLVEVETMAKELEHDNSQMFSYIQQRSLGKCNIKNLINLYEKDPDRKIVIEGLHNLYANGFITRKKETNFPLE